MDSPDALLAALKNPEMLHEAAPQIYFALTKFKEIQSLPEEQRNAAIQSILQQGEIKWKGDQPVPIELAQAILAIPTEPLDSLIDLTKNISEGTCSSQGIKPEDEVAELVKRSQACYISIPRAARKKGISFLPKEARIGAVALSFCKPDQLYKVVKDIPEIVKALELVAESMPENQNNSGSEKLSEEENKKTKESIVQALMLLQKTYVSFPERSRRTTMQLVPEQARPLVEAVEGMSSKRDFEKILSLMEGKDDTEGGSSNSSRESKFKSLKLKKAQSRGVASSSSGEEKEDQMSEAKQQARMAAAGVGLAARAERRRLWAWIRGDPCSLRVFNFLIGVFLIVSGSLGIFIEVFNRFRFFQIGIMFYCALFGWIFTALEVKSQLCSTYAVARIERYIGCLTTATGRGLFLAFSGLMCYAAYDPKSNGSTEFINFTCGIFCFALSIVNIVVGCVAAKRMKEARSNIASVEELKEKFDEYDLEMNGK